MFIRLINITVLTWPYGVSFYLKEDDWDAHRLDCGLTQRYLVNTADFMFEHSKLPDISILPTVSSYYARETLELDGNWPRSYSCKEEKCPKCGDPLSTLTKRRQNKNSDKQLLISKMHVIVIEILSKKCKKCYLIVSPNTLELGLINIGDVTLVSMDVFFTLQNTVRYVQ